MLLHDAPHQREPETRAAAVGGGRVKGLKDTLKHRGGHPAGVVAYLDDRLVALKARAQHDDAAGRIHRAGRVGDEVHKNLLQTSHMTENRDPLVDQLQTDLDLMGLQGHFAEPHRAADAAVQLDFFERRAVGAREVQEVAHEAVDALDPFDNMLEALPVAGVEELSAVLAQQVVGIVQNARQRVLQLVSHTCNKLTQTHQLLNTSKATLKLLD